MTVPQKDDGSKTHGQIKKGQRERERERESERKTDRESEREMALCSCAILIENSYCKV